MKGTIVKCMEELVEQKFGEAKWKECLKAAGILESRTFTILSDIDDKQVRAIMTSIARVLFVPMEQVFDDFGEYWSCVYAPRVYAPYFAGAHNARELLLNLDHIHEVMSKSVKLATPPRFGYEWRGHQLLVMHYQSARGFIDLMPGLIRDVGKYYNEKLRVRIVGNAVYVQFQ
jgi:hypothetical protein